MNMIIERRYECLGILLERDTKSKEVFYRVLGGYHLPLGLEELVAADYGLILHNADMGCGIPGDAYQMILTEFAKLDKTNPYDNGCTYRDVNEINHISSKSGKEISLIMKHRFDGIERIIQILPVRTEDGKTTIADPWDPKIYGKGI